MTDETRQPGHDGNPAGRGGACPPRRGPGTGAGGTARFTLDETRLAALAARYPVEDDHSAFLALETAILGPAGDPAGAVITGGPCDLAAELLADANGELDGYRLLIHPASGTSAPWIASNIERVSDRDPSGEPADDGGIYDTAEIIRDAVAIANELLAWAGR